MATTKRGKRIALTAGSAVFALAVLIGILHGPEIRSWYAFRRDFERLGTNAQGYLEYRHRETGIVFVRVPGGRFMMGSPSGEAGRSSDEALHEVRLGPFLIGKYEITQEQWNRVMGTTKTLFKGPNLPVDTVSWEDCQTFCEKTGLFLPTEAQWEYACRAGTTTCFYSGDSEDDVARVGWVRNHSGKTTHPVGQKDQPNRFGLHDMHGNVSEWCQDVYHREFYSRPEAQLRNPLCTSGSSLRVFRGGSWMLEAFSRCRSASRSMVDPVHRNPDTGFRVSWPLSGPRRPYAD